MAIPKQEIHKQRENIMELLQIKPKRINLCGTVRDMLIANNISSVKVVGAINAALGELKHSTSPDAKTGKGTVTKDAYRTGVSVSCKFKGEKNIALEFDTWNSRIEAAEKISAMEFAKLPLRFEAWLGAFTNKDKEKEEVPA